MKTKDSEGLFRAASSQVELGEFLDAYRMK